jgi:hypothetical protein
MASPAGRILRAVVGLAAASLGVVLLTTANGWGFVLLAVGAVFVIAGAANLCLLAPLLHVPFRGSRLQARP